MIKAVTVTNHNGEALRLDMASPENGLAITSIDGLGPVKNDISAQDLVGDGALFNSSRVGQRNIVIKLAFLESPTIEDARYRTYRYFPDKKPIVLKFETDSRVVEIQGYVESNEPDIFSPNSGTQISMLCMDPYFKGVAEDSVISVPFSTVSPAFQFPFENASTTNKVIELGTIGVDPSKNVAYLGEAPNGVLITAIFNGPVTGLAIHNTKDLTSFGLDQAKFEAIVGGPIAAADTLYISTFRGNKFVKLLRGGRFYNVLNAVSANACWFQLSPTDNVFAYTTVTGSENVQLTMASQILYEGI